ncbi:MAG TPA: hypothetical protein VFG43_03100 [Geminicoccaceae bacterium]|nr:hypothetical protein [Geminicoccaceae bacterium]
MRTLTIQVHVTEDGRLQAQAPPELPPGDHEAIIVLEEPAARGAFRIEDLPVDRGPWDSRISLRREDMYGDDGR